MCAKDPRRTKSVYSYSQRQAVIVGVTLDCHLQLDRFGTIEEDMMYLNNCGQIAYRSFYKVLVLHPYMAIDTLLLSPNQIKATLALYAPDGAQPQKVIHQLVENITKQYKMEVEQRCRKLFTIENTPITQLFTDTISIVHFRKPEEYLAFLQ